VAYAVRLLTEQAGASEPVVLFSAVAAGAVVYGGLLLAIRPQALRDVVALARPRAAGSPRFLYR
jgi:hypothetical protein